jgi:hypothetical protein
METYFKKTVKSIASERDSMKELVKDVLEYPIKAIPERNITKETCEVFGVRSAVDPTDGKTVTAIYFPYYDQKGKLTGYKKRDLKLDKHDKYHFTTVGKVGVDCKLFGQNVAEEVNRKRNNLIYVEGELDVLSSYQALVDSVADTKFSGMKPYVVGLSCGTANAVEATLHNETFVRSFDSVTLAFDSDSATAAEKSKKIMRGKEAIDAVASALIGETILCTITYDDGMKDPSDYLQAGKDAALAKLLQFGKKSYQAEKIVRANEISLESLIAPREEGIYIPQFPILNEKIKGFRKRELTLLTAPTSVGKSSITGIFASELRKAGQKVGMIFLEEETKESFQRIIALELKVNFTKFKANPLSVATEEQIAAVYDKIVGTNSLVFLDHFGSMPITELMNKVKHLHLVEGCDFIFLDHLSMVISGLESDDDRKNLDIVMTNLAAFCASNDVGVLAVSHINRKVMDVKHDDEEPYWVKVDKSHMRGSAALEQLSWTILGLEPEIMPDRSRGRVRLTVLKNRTWSLLGEADTFSLHPDTWEVVLSDTDTSAF